MIVLRDVVWRFSEKTRSCEIRFVSSPALLLMSALQGDKIILRDKLNVENLGTMFLCENQRKCYLDYFLLLLNFLELMPTEKQIEELRIFIKKYYEKDIYLLTY